LTTGIGRPSGKEENTLTEAKQIKKTVKKRVLAMIKMVNKDGFWNFAKIFLIGYPTIRDYISLHTVLFKSEE